MNMTTFIRQNRAQIDSAINRNRGYVPKTASCYCLKSGTDHHHDLGALNDSDRRQWILNDEGLFNWAVSKGVGR